MKERILIISAGLILFLWLLVYQSCTHDPIMLEEEMNGDTTTMDSIGVQDTLVVPDTTMQGNGSQPCSSDTVYFERDLLPLFQTNCALSGCHNAASAEDDVILESYNSIINSNIIDAYDLEDSDLYEVLTEDDEDKRMPPPPASRLTTEQINMIATWILQGARNIKCGEEVDGCDTSNVSYSSTVKPVIDTYCISCHSGPAASGGVNLDGYNNLKIVVDNGRFFGAISWAEGFENMPQGSNQLDDCILKQIKTWIDAGAPNN